MNSPTILILSAIALVVAVCLLLSKRSAHGLPASTVGSTQTVPADSGPGALSIHDTPDAPQSFGYKMAWLAIPTEDSAKVIGALGLKDAVPANWASGVGAVYSDNSQVFVTPPVEGWTLVVGHALPSFDTPERTRGFLAFINKVAASFPAFYYFGTHRVVDYHAWVKVAGGRIERAYAYLGERGETLYESGKKTNEEIALGFAFFDERSPEAAAKGYYERKDLRFPNEEDVMSISAAWALNTQALDKRTGKGTGHLARINWGRTNRLSQ